MAMNWDRKKINATKKVLKQHENLASALSDIAAVVKAPVTVNSVEKAFRRMGEPTPTSFCKPPEVHPVERLEMREQTSTERKQIDQLARELREANARQDFLERMRSHEAPPSIIRRERTSNLREMTAVVGASDWHVEETVDPEAIAFRNKYNLEIAGQRIERFFNGIAWNIEHHRASRLIVIHDLVLWLGGDLMSGYIHEELIENNQLSPTETILWLLPRLNGGLRMLRERLGINVVVPCSYGNHGRTTHKPRISSGPQNSYEWLMYHNLSRELADDKGIRFEITKSAHQYVQVYDKTLHFHHGDDVKFAGGVGGITIPLKKRIPSWDLIRRADYHHIGHFHQYNDFGRTVANGSLIGYGPYSQRIGAEIEEPQQFMYLLDSERGKCQSTPLWVGERARTEEINEGVA
jgi:hypothetical protein